MLLEERQKTLNEEAEKIKKSSDESESQNKAAYLEAKRAYKEIATASALGGFGQHLNLRMFARIYASQQLGPTMGFATPFDDHFFMFNNTLLFMRRKISPSLINSNIVNKFNWHYFYVVHHLILIGRNREPSEER